ncbi:MAG: RNA-guided endonuclease TnpB family protein, partial [Thermosynechococcus sp.]
MSRYVYNKTIEYLKEPRTKAKWMTVARIIIDNLPEWAKSVPYQIKKIAVKDAYIAFREAKKKFKQTGKIHECRFRSRKDKQQTVFIPKTAISESGIYHTILGKAQFKERLPKSFSDGRLTLAYGEYYLIVSE